MSTNQYLSEDQFNEIERYLNNTMSEEEAYQFALRLENDPNLRRKADELKLLQLGIEQSALEDRLQYFHENITQPKIKSLGVRKWFAAAAILVLIAAGTLWLIHQRVSQNDLFATYFKPDPGLISSMGNSDQYEFDKAMVDYKTGNYQVAVDAWKNLQQPGVTSDTLNYFIGAAYTALRNSDSAIVYLQPVAQNSNSLFYDDANWYAGLVYVLENNKTEAIQYIKRSSHKDRDKLLSKLQQ